MNHTKKDLQQLSDWDVYDAHNLIERIKEMWVNTSSIKEFWGVDRVWHKNPILILELHTIGWSANEEIIKALQCNKLFWFMWWQKTERGGHYYFEIDYSQIGFIPVAEFKVREHTYAQYIYKMKKKYDWVKISARKRLIRNKVKN